MCGKIWLLIFDFANKQKSLRTITPSWSCCAGRNCAPAVRVTPNCCCSSRIYLQLNLENCSVAVGHQSARDLLSPLTGLEAPCTKFEIASLRGESSWERKSNQHFCFCHVSRIEIFQTIFSDYWQIWKPCSSKRPQRESLDVRQRHRETI